MKFARLWDRLVKGHWQEVFRRGARKGIQSSYLAKRIRQVIEQEKVVDSVLVKIPVNYLFFLSEHDYKALKPSIPLIVPELQAYIQTYANQNNYQLEHRPSIKFYCDSSLKVGHLIIRTNPATMPEGDLKPSSVDLSSTLIFDKTLTKQEIIKPSIKGVLRVIEGNDVGVLVELLDKRVNIGRRKSNELPLTDVNISRLHAYIILEAGAHVVYDAKSLNGTYVNEQKIYRHQLQSSDRIRIGNTIIAYEINDTNL